MVGIFNSENFVVQRGPDIATLRNMANTSYEEFKYGREIKYSKKSPVNFMNMIYSSFGYPSFIIEEANDGPVDCWVITSNHRRNIIYIEYWKCTSPGRMYIFFNNKNRIPSLFLKNLYESAVSG